MIVNAINLRRGMFVMEYLFLKLLLLCPVLLFLSLDWKGQLEIVSFFQFFYYFYWFLHPLLFSFKPCLTVFSVLFFFIVLRNLIDIKLWGIWFLFLLLAIGSDLVRLISVSKKMFGLRRELGSKCGRDWFISVWFVVGGLWSLLYLVTYVHCVFVGIKHLCRTKVLAAIYMRGQLESLFKHVAFVALFLLFSAGLLVKLS